MHFKPVASPPIVRQSSEFTAKRWNGVHWVSDIVTTSLWHSYCLMTTPLPIPKCHFITVGLSSCDKIAPRDHFLSYFEPSHNIRYLLYIWASIRSEWHVLCDCVRFVYMSWMCIDLPIDVWDISRYENPIRIPVPSTMAYWTRSHKYITVCSNCKWNIKQGKYD